MSFSDDIRRAKERLPLPELLRALGDEAHARKAARSPFRDGDNKSCFGIFKTPNGRWHWKDQVTGLHGDEIDYLVERRGLTPEAAQKEFLRMAGIERAESGPMSRVISYAQPVAQPQPTRVLAKKYFDWEKCVADFPEHLDEVAEWRGYSAEFLQCFHSVGGIGWHEGGVAFPVANAAGDVIGCHYRCEEGTWMYTHGCKVRPFVLGDPATARQVLFFESQWDAMAFADRLGWQDGFADDFALVATRGAGNGRLAGEFVREGVALYLVPQNDAPDPRTGKCPAEEWARAVVEAVGGVTIARVVVPKSYKDANDWTRAGVTGPELIEVIGRAAAWDPDLALTPVFTAQELMDFQVGTDPDCILGDRWLGKSGSCLWLGPSGLGKSALCVQAAAYWALGLPLFGIQPAKPLRSVIYQAEDDMGDCAEFFQGVMQGMLRCDKIEFDDAKIKLLSENFVIVRDVVHRGESFAKFARADITRRKADLAWINPLFSFAGCGVSDQSAMSAFLREMLNPIAIETGVCWQVVHHTAKPSSDPKARQHWNDADYAYSGFGSSEITNWARAINVLQPQQDVCKLLLAKRGRRAHATPDPTDPDEFGTTLYLSHHDEFIYWLQTKEPPEEREKKARRHAKSVLEIISISYPAANSEITLAVQREFKCSQFAAEKRVTRWIKEGVFTKNASGYYSPISGK